MSVSIQNVPAGRLRRKAGSITIDLIAVLGILFVVGVIWFPFSLKIMGLVEEWDLMAHLDSPANLLSFIHNLFPIRPLVIVPFAAGYLLTPGSYVGLNIVQLLLFFVKGVLVYSLLRRLLPTKPAFAFLTSALFIIYPADSELFAMRHIATHFALCCYLLSVYLLVIYWKRPRALILGLTCFALAFSLLVYEAGYPLVAVSPLILLWLEGRLTKRVLRIAAVWYSVPLVCAAWGILQLSGVQNAQQNLFLASGARISFADNVRGIADNLLRAYTRSLFSSWQDAISRLPNSAFLLGALLIVVVGGGMTWWLTRPSVESFPKDGPHEFLMPLANWFVPAILHGSPSPLYGGKGLGDRGKSSSPTASFPALIGISMLARNLKNS